MLVKFISFTLPVSVSDNNLLKEVWLIFQVILNDCRPILHKYANEDVSLGAWFIGLEVEHIDDRNMCCGTPPDCEWKAQAGNVCVASFDWSCSGICKSVEKLKTVHERCGEGDDAVWNTLL
ncbi:beta-1,3-galactosyltransferase 7 isoform X2 [Gossypium australe]|uniref:Beta-1,3-galactosyltransferase 7 isoform X2 n=1 Tax=Gossypium australe TaxID=47621 RepID=A0A5B6W661_9ROSI|nr:beta-1,3-galactosyltransferase 7 isoform X2 [Gossypium australe]